MSLSLKSFLATAVLATLVQGGTLQTRGASLERCPLGERTTGSLRGTVYAICPDTDYWSPNLSVLPNVADVETCAKHCSEAEGCAKGSYKPSIKECYLKGDPVGPRWFADKALLSLRAANIAKCPAGERRVTIGKNTFIVCPNSDYWSPNTAEVPNVANIDACVEACARNGECEKASYHTERKTCYIKGKPKSPVWFATGPLDTVTMVVNVDLPAVNTPTAPTGEVPAKNPVGPNQVGNNSGQWGQVFPLPVIPVAGYIVPEFPESNKLMFWSAWSPNKFSLWSPANGYTAFGEYNYKTGAVSSRTVANTGHDMFCPGVSTLQDGRIVVAGGTNAEVTSIYDPKTNAFTRGPDMKIARGYQTQVTTSAGNIFTVGGSFSGVIGGKVGEMYNPTTNSWNILPGAKVEPILTSYDWEGPWRTDNHAWLFAWTGGSVFHAGPSKMMHWFDTNGQGNVQDAGIRDPEADAMCGVNVMYDVGKIFSAGGSQSYTASPATTRAHIITLGKPFANPTVERLPDMHDARGFANVVVLPNGQVMVSGGQRVSRVFQDDESVLTPELFDPNSKTFRKLAPETEPRNYHAISILLGDGRVLTGGGGMCGNLAPGQSEQHCNRAVDHQNGQIYSPPYLFNDDMTPATRPIIFAVNGLADERSAKVGGKFTVHMNYPEDHTFSLVRIGSVTHSINSDQRRIPLTDFTRTAAAFEIRLPTDAGVLVPGHWFLFAMNNRGVPSVARTIQIVA